MEKSEMIKLIAQYLNDKGYSEVSQILQKETSTSLECENLKPLKKYISNGEFDSAINIIKNNCEEKEHIYLIPKIRLTQIFESLLEQFVNYEGVPLPKQEIIKKKNEALILIRNICNSSYSYEKDDLIRDSINLVFIDQKEELVNKMKEMCMICCSRESLKDYIESILSQSTSLLRCLHPKSLQNMLDNLIKNQIENCKYHTYTEDLSFSYFEDHQCSESNIPYKLSLSIEEHDEEVLNIICSNSESLVAILLKNNFVIVYKISHKIQGFSNNVNQKQQINIFLENQDAYFNSKINSGSTLNKYILIFDEIIYFKLHDNQVTSLVFSSCENYLLSASKDKTAKIHHIYTGKCVTTFDHGSSMCSSAIFLENDNTVLTSCLGQCINLWSRQGVKISSFPTVTINEILFSKKHSVLLLVAPTLKAIIIYNLDKRIEVSKLMINDTIISCALSKIDEGEFLLVNSSNSTPVLSLWSLSENNILRKYFGHRQEKLAIKCSFGGVQEKFVLSGSDNKEIYIWNRNSTVPSVILKAHSSCVNSVLWFTNSLFSNIIISGSDDHTIKIFSNEKVGKIEFNSDSTLRGSKSEKEKNNFQTNGNDDEESYFRSRSESYSES
jgi:WD40 repeat protein